MGRPHTDPAHARTEADTRPVQSPQVRQAAVCTSVSTPGCVLTLIAHGTRIYLIAYGARRLCRLMAVSASSTLARPLSASDPIGLTLSPPNPKPKVGFLFESMGGTVGCMTQHLGWDLSAVRALRMHASHDRPVHTRTLNRNPTCLPSASVSGEVLYLLRGHPAAPHPQPGSGRPPLPPRAARPPQPPLLPIDPWAHACLRHDGRRPPTPHAVR